MKEAKGNLFRTVCDAICITTNGFYKTNGNAVMGRGCALQASELYPDIKVKLGNLLRTKGNHVHYLGTYDGKEIVSFPVKPITIPFIDNSQIVSHMRGKFLKGHIVPGWACVANINIIQDSAKELVALTNRYGWTDIVLPRPGCGAGELVWNNVKPVLEDILDDRFTCITY